MKFKKNFKKGFTLVELIVVIAIVAILAAVSVVSYIAFINSANESADIQLVKQLNTCLQADEALHGKRDWSGDYSGMTNLLESNGFIVENLTKTKSGCDMVYQGSDKNGKIINRYALLKGEDVIYSETTFDKDSNYRNLWIPETFEEAQNLANSGKGVVLGPELGVIDVDFTAHGSVIVNNATISKIRYSNDGAGKTVVMNTCSYDTSLIIDAPYDTVHHYGQLMSAELKKISTSSYFEHGDSNLVEIASGRLVITNDQDAKVDNVFLTATEDNYKVDDIGIIIALQKGAKLPESIRRDVVTETSGKAVCTIQTNVDENGENPEKVDNVTILGEDNVQEASNGYTNVADLTKMVLEAPAGSEEEGAADYIGNDVAVTPEEKEGIINEAKGTVIQVTFNNEVTLHTISEFRDKWNAGEFFSNEKTASVKLIGNVDMSKIGNWGPIGTWKYPFFGTFDGQKSETENYSISNLSNHNAAAAGGSYTHVYATGTSVGYGETYGFFGIVGGGDVTVKNIKFEAVDIDIENGKNVGAVIGYAPKVNSSFNEDTISKTGAITFNKVEVSGSVSANAHGAGLIGKVYSTGKLTMNNCINSADISSGNNCGGLVGYIAGPTEIEITGCTNNGNVHNTATSSIQVGYFAVVNTHNATDKITLTNNTNNGHCINGNAFHNSYNNPSFLTMSSSGSVVQNSAGLYDFSGNVDNGYLYQIGNVNYKAYVIVPKNGTASLDVEGNYENNSIKVNGTVNISKGTFGDVGHDHGTLNISGGTFNKISTNAVVNISGGTFVEISAAYGAYVDITGGTIGQVRMTTNNSSCPEISILTSLSHGLTIVRGGGGNNLYIKVEESVTLIKAVDNGYTGEFDPTGWTKLNSSLTWTSFVLD